MSQLLPNITEINVAGKSVLVRADLEWEGDKSPREIATREIVAYLENNGAGKIKVIGHKGRASFPGVEVVNDIRADAREKTDDVSFAEELAQGWEIYVNESFAESHRKYVSVDALPRSMKKQGKWVGVGMRFAKEIEVLSKVFAIPGRKVLVIGGAKAGDKAIFADDLVTKFDAVLRGGLLPGASLRTDGLDISEATIEEYKNKIANAGLVVVAGPMGKYEEVPTGTQEVFSAAASSPAYKIAGGGDTEAAIDKFGLREKFDWISVGGGAMLEFLDKGTLPGIEAVVS